MFSIEGTHITQLNDTDLRILVARLCEAELRHRGLAVSAVTAGGHQNAADGGLDVRVDLPSDAKKGDFIPCSKTGFQVKVPDMPRAKILNEMCPKGNLRPAISDLISLSGAYVIISANGSTADSPLQQRKEAMREALSGIESAEDLTIDFYDRERVAAWVRCYPGLVAWVRGKIGQPLREWQPYSNWAAKDESLDGEYLIDDKCRLVDDQKPRDGALSIEVGIERIRTVLSTPQGSVRLVGLSGTGKTRLAQALFDERIGDKALDSTIAVYTDLGLSPLPSPRDLISHLIQNGLRAIVLVDNCPPETHKALADACMAPECKLSLMTIEYDVGDDTPEKTDVFSLYPSSENIIERLLESHAPQVSQVDRHHIAELSDGNARIALTLAHTVRRGESVSDLSDKALFERLFYQRHQPDQSLMRSAEAISLVYSFNGEDVSGDAAELPFLASMVGQNSDELYRNIAELRNRELVQARSKWRALLPHALANRIAHQSLERIHPDTVAKRFTNQPSARLLRSFSRRLSFLHDSKCAQKIVQSWLAKDGFLSAVHNLNDLGLAMFQYIAPVQPELVLEAIERVIESEHGKAFIAVSNKNRQVWIGLLRSLAYDAGLFDRSILFIVRFVIAEPPKYKTYSARDAFISLFHLYLSGTHATVEQRVNVVKLLLQREDEDSQTCGLDALDAMMNAWHFSSSHEFTFGARPRDYGWEPETWEEQTAWFEAVISYALGLAISGKENSEKVKTIIANNFRAMLNNGNLIEMLEGVGFECLKHGSWLDGWKAIRQTIYFDAKNMPADLSGRLKKLEELLRPQSLEQRILAYVLCQRWGTLEITDGESVDDEDDEIAPHLRVEQIGEQLGREAASDSTVLESVLPKLVSGDIGLGWVFGRGLAFEVISVFDTWRLLVKALTAISKTERNYNVLRGFISGANERDSKIAGMILDQAISDPVLGPDFSYLQASIDIDAVGVNRLLDAIKFGLVSSEGFRAISYGGVTASTPHSLLGQLIQEVSLMKSGYAVAVDIFDMRLYAERGNKVSLADELVQCGQILLRSAAFDQKDSEKPRRLAHITRACFSDGSASDAASEICRNFIAAISKNKIYMHDYIELLGDLFRLQPTVALDEFLGEQEGDEKIDLYSMFNEKLPINEVSAEIVITWAKVNPGVRFLRLAKVISPVETQNGQAVGNWSSVALAIIDSAPDKEVVFEAFTSNITPRSWSGSRAKIIEGRRSLPQALFEHSDPIVASKARELDARLHHWAEAEAKREKDRVLQIDESFE